MKKVFAISLLLLITTIVFTSISTNQAYAKYTNADQALKYCDTHYVTGHVTDPAVKATIEAKLSACRAAVNHAFANPEDTSTDYCYSNYGGPGANYDAMDACFTALKHVRDTGIDTTAGNMHPSTAPISNPSIPEITHGNLFDNLIDLFLWAIGVLAVAVLLYASFRLVTARGDVDQAKSARRIIIWSSIGLALVILAGTIISIINGVFST